MKLRESEESKRPYPDAGALLNNAPSLSGNPGHTLADSQACRGQSTSPDTVPGPLRAFTQARIALPDKMLSPGYIILRDGIIVDYGEGALPGDCRDCVLSSLEGRIISPGLLELHIHGAGGIGFDSVRGPEDIHAVHAFLARHGVTGFVPTILCDEAAITALVAAIEASGLPESVIPGIYIEGPFVNPSRRGGIPLRLIREPDPDYLVHILELTRGRLKIMTVAPELPGIQSVYELLASRGVRISLGHSDCDLSSAPLPLTEFSVTHLFNAMSGVSHKTPGLANLPFSDSRPYVELNADSVHVNRESMRLVHRGIPSGRLALTSDAVVAAGLPFGLYPYFGFTVRSGQDGVRYEETGTLMGSNRVGSAIIRSFLSATDAPVEYALRSATDTPAAIAGVRHLRGRIERGMGADLVSWDEKFLDPLIFNPVTGTFEVPGSVPTRRQS